MARLRLLPHIPTTPAELLAAEVQKFLLLPDPAPLWALLGALAGNIIEGPPVWLMLIGSPGTGKTELLNSLRGIGHVVAVDSIDGPAAFLSGTGRKETADDATGGVLPQIGLHGGIVIKDFTGVLSLEPARRRLVLDCLRQVYDGSWVRPVGSDGGKTLRWPAGEQEGHAALFAGVTGEIDQQHTASAALGERWLYYRFPQPDHFARTRQSGINRSRPGWKRELQDVVTRFVLAHGLGFGERVRHRDITDTEFLRLSRMASVTARCRSSVPRDNYRHEVIGVPETETGQRVYSQLVQLLLGMDYIGVTEAERWRILAQIALDSVPLLRRLILREACMTKDGATYQQLAAKIGVSASTAERAVEDLKLHGAVQVIADKGRAARITLSDELRREWDWKMWGN